MSTSLWLVTCGAQAQLTVLSYVASQPLWFTRCPPTGGGSLSGSGRHCEEVGDMGQEVGVVGQEVGDICEEVEDIGQEVGGVGQE